MEIYFYSLICSLCPLAAGKEEAKKQITNEKNILRLLLLLCHSTNQELKELQNYVVHPPMEECHQRVELFLII